MLTNLNLAYIMCIRKVKWLLSSAGEQGPYKAQVVGSIPTAITKI